VAPASLSTVESSARGRDANIAYLYERIAEGDHEHAEQPTARTSCAASPATTPRSWYAASSPPATTGHAPPTRSPQAPTARGISPGRVRSLSDRRAYAVQSRRTAYRHWHEETPGLVAERQRWIDQHIGRDRSRDQGLDDGIDV